MDTKYRWRVTTAPRGIETVDAAKVAVNDRNGVMMVLDADNSPTHFFRHWVAARRVSVISSRWTADVTRFPHREGGSEFEPFAYRVTLFPLDAIGQPVDVDVATEGGEPIAAQLVPTPDGVSDGVPEDWHDTALQLARGARDEHRRKLQQKREVTAQRAARIKGGAAR